MGLIDDLMRSFLTAAQAQKPTPKPGEPDLDPPGTTKEAAENIESEVSTVQAGEVPVLEPQADTQHDQIGNIYLDFDRNADDNTDAKGQFFVGLRQQMVDLRRRHAGALFPDVTSAADLLRAFQESFFPHGMAQSFVICNLSLQQNRPFLIVRPRVIGPRLEPLMPRGLALAISAKLHDSQRDPNNPVLLVQRIIDISHSEPRSFERETTAFVFCQADTIYPAHQRGQNVITSDFVASLPAISVMTRERLQDWRAYLDWKERLIRANLVGLRYIQVELEKDMEYRFLVVAESREAFDHGRLTLKNSELRAFGLGYSQDPWVFEYNETHRGRDTELGDYAGFEEAGLSTDVNTEGMPWDAPFCANVYFRLSEDAQNEFEAIVGSGGILDDVRASLRDTLPSSGFLALSVVGDIALVRRQRRELNLLQEQSGYAPLLSSYLFDIKAANIPSELVNITDDQWYRNDLNDNQRLAVRKMVSTPDLAMVQGPPGTGKTTMIAEAIWQFVRQGKKVLVVSQANLAVDNALERLAQAPAVRAIRLGRKGDKDHPFSQRRVLETYYQSIAKACSKRTLDVWQNSDSQISTLTKWLANVDLVTSDISKFREDENRLSFTITNLRTSLEAHEASVERASGIERERAQLIGFLDVLAGGVEWTGELPASILRLLWDSVVTPLQSLVNVGIRVNRLWPDFDYGSLSERARFILEVLQGWRDIETHLPHLNGDLERLRSSNSETVLATEDSLHLAKLTRLLHTAQQAMEDDASKVTEWQAIKKEIRALKRRGSGLDRSIYERIFSENLEGSPAYLAYTHPNASRLQVVAQLQHATEAINATQEKVAEGLLACRQSIQSYLQEIVVPACDPTEAQRLLGQMRDTTQRLRETRNLRVQKEARILELLAAQLLTGAPGGLDVLPTVRSDIANHLERLRYEHERAREYREAWEPVLKKWVTDLTRPQSIQNDQSTFLPNYIRSCNVVGVTCTENRKTLDECGHTRFDVTIVDEVSKATPPEIIMPLSMARTAILVGDHRQLPPLFKERDGSFEEALAAREENNDSNSGAQEVDPTSELTPENFERFRKMVTSSIFKEHFENAPNELKSFLFTQYRMHPQIMQVVNQFYENRLECGLTDPDGATPGSDYRGHRIHGMTLKNAAGKRYLTPEQHVLWLDSTTDPKNQTHFERRDGASSKANDLEAILIARCLFDIEMACRDQGFGRGGKKPQQVGVITFYGRQVRTIRDAVRRLQRNRQIEFGAIRYDINTVDRYQGQERPIVLVSMVRNPPWKLSARANTAQFERINVAFSRAQELLIITGAKDVFCSYPVDLPNLDRPGRKKVEVYRYIIDEIQRRGGYWRAKDILDPQEYERLLPQQPVEQKRPTPHGGRR